MKFEYEYGISRSNPSLVIEVADILKAKDFQKNQKAEDERRLLNKCFSIYSKYYGVELFMPTAAFEQFCSQIGKKGKVIFFCESTETGIHTNLRVVSDQGERLLPNNFFMVL